MGQKVSPVGLRVGIIRDWDSKWYADKNQVGSLLLEDVKVRKYLMNFYSDAAVSRIEIERLSGKSQGSDRLILTIHTAKPGMVIGKDAEKKNKAIETVSKMTKKNVILNIVEVKKPELDAKLVAESIAKQLENRASFRRAQKVAIQRALKTGALGVRTVVSGRLGGAEMARHEGYSEGRVPLHTLRADVDYYKAEALTTYGLLGVKVWIYKGEILPQKKETIKSKGGK